MFWRISILMAVALVVLAGCGKSENTPPDKAEPSDFKLVLGDDKALIKEDARPHVDDKRPFDRKQQTVKFLNSQGTGRRFCIIADCSNSLSGLSFGLIKRELIKTLETLDEESQFHVMFFSGKPFPMPGGGWLHGKKDVDKVKPWIEKMGQSSGTIATPAFRRALELSPRPDVVFFMTDGQLAKGDPEKVADLNRAEPRVVFHTILFRKTVDVAPPENPARVSLEKIAADSAGTFKQFIDPDVLPKKKKKKGT